jgi:hypothetical protein
MGSTIRFMSSVSYFVSSRCTTVFSYTKWPGTAQSVMWLSMGCTDTTLHVAGARIFLLTITLSISVLWSSRRWTFWVTGRDGAPYSGAKQWEGTPWSSGYHFCTVLRRIRFWNSVWSLTSFMILLVPAGEFWNYVYKYVTATALHLVWV